MNERDKLNKLPMAEQVQNDVATIAARLETTEQVVIDLLDEYGWSV